jgi:uncharacterized protein
MDIVIIYNIILIVLIIIASLQYIKLNNMFEPIKRDKILRINLQKHLLGKIKKKYPSIVFEDIMINNKNGNTININIFKVSKNKKWIFYLHGNKYDVLHYYKYIKQLLNIGNVLLFDYRGYGLSEGFPSPRGCVEDTLLVWDYFLKNIDSSHNTIYYGNSLGAGIACKTLMTLIEQKKKIPSGVLLESTFTSITDMAKKRYPTIHLLFSNLLYDTLNSKKNLRDIIKLKKKLVSKILISHSKEDEIIPYDHSLELHSINKNIKHLVIQGEHGDENIDDVYLNEIKKLF